MFFSKVQEKKNWRSAIFTGQVRHRRYTPKKHQFQYSLYLNYLDLDEVAEIFSQGFLSKPWSPIRFKRQNYLESAIEDLKDAVWNKVQELGGEALGGPVFLLTSLSYFGFCFNPVSFYYCYDHQQNLQYILAEINNTPWDQRHCYLLNAQGQKVERHFDKDFHVSPFMPMEMSYHWRFNTPGKNLQVHMKNLALDQKEVFHATLSLQRKRFSHTALFKLALLQPLIPLKIIGAIYWHALILKLKGVPFYSKPDDLPDCPSKDQHSPSKKSNKENSYEH